MLVDKIHEGRGGDAIEVEDGGFIVLKSGGRIHGQAGSRQIADEFILPKTFGKGILVDPDNPALTWRDMKGPIVASTTGAGRPTLTTYAGNTEEYAFAAGDKYSTIKLHVDHDWAGAGLLLMSRK